MAYLTGQPVSARSVPRLRNRIFRMNNCWANAYLRAKAGEANQRARAGTAGDTRRETHVHCAPAIDPLQPDKWFLPFKGNVGFPPIRPRRICGNDVEPDANEIVFLHAMELFGGFEGSCRAVRRASAWNIQATSIPSSGSLSPTLAVTPRAAHCGKFPVARGHRVRAVCFRVSSPFAIPTAQRWRSPKRRLPQRPRTQPRTRVTCRIERDSPNGAPASAIASTPRIARTLNASRLRSIVNVYSAKPAAAPPADRSILHASSNAAPAGSVKSIPSGVTTDSDWALSPRRSKRQRHVRRRPRT